MPCVQRGDEAKEAKPIFRLGGGDGKSGSPSEKKNKSALQSAHCRRISVIYTEKGLPNAILHLKQTFLPKRNGGKELSEHPFYLLEYFEKLEPYLILSAVLVVFGYDSVLFGCKSRGDKGIFHRIPARRCGGETDRREKNTPPIITF